ncbi:discoidin domain-containing protein [Luteolibacter pohnpeiensis]|uniref:Discoidin domain-containing protein n=1 Tax=Luteolibacter pohnpeiensis TaxID=454153 RepID=A0A934VXJ5_9BACT|nr:discoidin domain-containing protein [Luteolibacter pohnpeiensis]MBK1883913.1 discoidin domain-containing protein [Luteolibacter pohnpeiensis]
MSEFTFSYQGTLLNLNNRDGTGVDVVTVSATSGTQDPAAAEGTNMLFDGLTTTKWFRAEALVTGNELVIDFGTAPPTFDSYNFANANDNATYIRTPISWTLAGSDDGTDWIPLDVRSNEATVRTNYAYQVGYDIPDAIPPVIDYFNSYSTDTAGYSAIMLNGSSTYLAWVTGNTSVVNLIGPSGTPISVPLNAETGYAVTPPSNATSVYTLQAIAPSGGEETATATVRTVVGGSSTYQYVRYTPMKRRGGTVPGEVQLSEFQFFNGSSQLTVSAVSNIGGSNGDPASTSTETAASLIDNNTATKWYDGNSAPVIFDFGTPQTFDGYRFATGNDAASRDPIQWTLEGSNDQSTWTMIENVDFDYPVPLERNRSSYDIPLPGSSISPRIVEFTGSASEIFVGESVTLTYSVGGATSVSLNGEVLPAFSGEVVVTPTVSTTYTLTVATATSTEALTASFDVVVYDDPGLDGIDYDDFASAGADIRVAGSAEVTDGVLRLTPDEGSQSGAAYFYKKLNGTAGFEMTFGLHLNIDTPVALPPADGIAVVIHNADGGVSNVGTGETGIASNSLNIMFKSFDFTAINSSVVQVLSGTTALSQATSIYQTPGTEIIGIPEVLDSAGNVVAGGYPYTLATLSTERAYQVRIVYVPGDLDVYFDGIAVIQNVDVNLEDIGATDENGFSYFGFTARTGLYTENNDIVDWKVQMGDFTEDHDFGMMKTIYKTAPGSDVPTDYDLVWYGHSGYSYDVEYTSDLVNWSPLITIDGLDGQLGYSVQSLPDTPMEFYRVVESESTPEQ